MCSSELSVLGMDPTVCYQSVKSLSSLVEQIEKLRLEGLHNQFSHMKGVIYLKAVNNCTIENNVFKLNDALPIYDSRQEIGLVYQDKDVGYAFS